MSLLERDSTETHPAEPSRDTSFRSLCVAACSFGAWLLALLGLVLTSANPITLNLTQIRQADFVLEAEIIDAQRGECRVIQSWPPRPAGEMVTIRGLRDLAVETGESYLLPVALDENGYLNIVLTPPPESPPQIYPVTDALRRQIRELRE